MLITDRNGRPISLKLSPAQSRPSSHLANEATDLLAAICGAAAAAALTSIGNDSAGDVKFADLIRPGLPFFLSEALEHTATNFVAIVGEDILANAVETDHGRAYDSGGELDVWVPLHLLSFCGSFVRDFLVFTLAFLF